MPYVTANGNPVRMFQAVGGYWVGYIAATSYDPTTATHPANPPPLTDNTANDISSAADLQKPPATGGAKWVVQLDDPGSADDDTSAVDNYPYDYDNRLSLTAPATVTIEYFDASENVSLQRTVTYDTTTATISLDRNEYPRDAIVYAEVYDPDMNKDPTNAEAGTTGIIKLTIGGSTLDPTSFTETDRNTATFKAVFSLTGTTEDNLGQSLTVNYNNGEAVASAVITAYTGSLSLDKDEYVISDKAVITLVDPDLNKDSGSTETYSASTGQIVKVYSEEEGTDGAHWVTMKETGDNTGIFEGKFTFGTSDSPNADTGIPQVGVTAGAKVTVTYTDDWDADGNTNVAVTKTVTYKSNTGSVSFESTAYGPKCMVKIVLTDPDLNMNAYTKETVTIKDDSPSAGKWQLVVGNVVYPSATTGWDNPPVRIYSSSWTTGWPTEDDDSTAESIFSLTETDVNTGVFTYITDQLSTLSDGNAVVGDTLYVQYIDPANDAGTEGTVSGTALITAWTGTLTLDKETVAVKTPEEKIKITLEDPDRNINPDGKETGDNRPQVTVTSSEESITVTLEETGKNTGIFEKEIKVDDDGVTGEQDTIEVNKGETVTVKYTDPNAAGGATGVKVTATFNIYSTDGSVSFDKDTYSQLTKAKITITDPDMNEDPLAVDTIPGSRIKVYSTTDPSGIGGYTGTSFPGARETGADTGVFTVTISLTTGTSNEASSELQVSNGDSIVVAYTEEADAAGNTDVLRMATAKVWYTTASLTFDKDTYTMDETATLTLTEPDKNASPTLKESVTITVYSTSDPAGITLSLLETDVNTGVFTGTLTFTTGASTGTMLKVATGDTITAIYTDTTPYEAPEISSKRITATATIGTPVSALPITAGAPSFVGPTGEAIETPTVGTMVLVSTELSNTATIDQQMLYIIQIKDATGRVVYMSYISGTVPAGKAFTFGLPWTPEEAGTYTIEIYAWKSWDEPTPLSEPVSQTITVTE
jgi:hypothetical protein